MVQINYGKLLKKRLPIIKWLPQYTLSTLLQDFLAGLTVGMTEIPQAIAYATLAGLPPEYGLYSGLAEGFIYAIFGGCKDLNIGPSSVLSLLIQHSALRAGPVAATLMTFLSGLIILFLGVLQLGFIVQFFSYPVIAAFISSGVVVITCGQIVHLLGLRGKSDTFINSWTTIAAKISETRKWDAVLGVTTIVILLILERIRKFGSLQKRQDWSPIRNAFGKVIVILSLSRSAIVLVIGTALSYCLRQEETFTITGQVSQSFPKFHPPTFSTTFNGTYFSFEDLITGYGAAFVSIPLLSILEAVTIAKVFSNGRQVDATQEMLALGLCNTIGSFVGSMPVTGSFTRSAVNHASGVKTTFGGVFTSILLLLTIAFLTPSFYYVPKATLASILVCAIYHLFDYKAFTLLYKSNKLDLIPLLTTFFTCMFLGIDYGILIGATVNLVFVLYASARPKFNITKEKISNDQNEVYVITPKDTLFYPAAEYLRDTALEIEGNNVTVVINGKYIRKVDTTVARSIAVLTHELILKNRKVFFVDFKDSAAKVCVSVDSKLKDHFVSEEYFKSRIKDQHREFTGTTETSQL